MSQPPSGPPRHHPPEEDPLAHAAASDESPAVALVAACHLSLCDVCRRQADLLDAVDLLESEPPQKMRAGALEAALGRLDQPPSAASGDALAPTSSVWPGLPAPLRRCLAASPAARFKLRVPGVRAIDLPLARSGERVRLVKLAPGQVIPSHDHGGTEYTLVLDGGLRDGGEQYERGVFRRCGNPVTSTSSRSIARARASRS